MSGGIELSAAGAVLGSEGMRVDRLGPRVFSVQLASSRGLPACPNMLQFQLSGAARDTVEIEVTFEHGGSRAMFDEYHHAATPDFSEFRILRWEHPPNGETNRLRIPATGWDCFSVGMQCPLPNEALAVHVARWAEHPHADVSAFGYSALGRPIWRVAVDGSGGSARWRHCVANFHPGEGNARWRMVGMVDWLLSEAGAAARRGCAVDFFPLLCPDGPANGWRRVDASGVDMNRCFLMDGPDAARQPREAYLFQSYLETACAGNRPLDTLWCMHTWPGAVEPLMDGLGPEFGVEGERFAAFRDTLKRADRAGRIKPAATRPELGMAASWNGGAHRRHGITSVLVEGGGDAWNVEEHIETGQDLMSAIGAFWSDDLPRPERKPASSSATGRTIAK